MKIFTLLAILLTLSSCGLQNQIDEQRIKNNKTDADISNLQNQVLADEARLLALESNLRQSLGMINAQLISLRNYVTTNSNLSSQQVGSLNYEITLLKYQSNALAVQLAIIKGYTGIVEVFNPCGDQNALDEVFLKLSDGRYLASFSETASGQNTRFSLLKDGNYQTTDGVQCKFTVSGNGTIISNERL